MGEETSSRISCFLHLSHDGLRRRQIISKLSFGRILGSGLDRAKYLGDTEWQPQHLLILPAAKSPPNHNPQAHTCPHSQSLPPIPSARASTGEELVAGWRHHPGKLSICNACSAPPGLVGRLLPSVGSRRAFCFTRLHSLGSPWLACRLAP